MRKTPNSELQRLSINEFKQANKQPIVVVLDNVRSAYNVGAVFRTADAFLINAIYLCGITACPPHKEIRKTALGASDTIHWQYHADTLTLVQQLKNESYTVLAIEQADQSIALQNFTVDGTKKYAIVFGHEVKGVSQAVMDMIDHCIEIPQFGTKHSLNISVSVGVVLWDFSKQQIESGVLPVKS